MSDELDDTIFEDPSDEKILTDTRTFRREVLTGTRKAVHLCKEHKKILEGDAKSDPIKHGLIRDVASNKQSIQKIEDEKESQEKTKKKWIGAALVAIITSAISAIAHWISKLWPSH